MMTLRAMIMAVARSCQFWRTAWPSQVRLLNPGAVGFQVLTQPGMVEEGRLMSTSVSARPGAEDAR